MSKQGGLNWPSRGGPTWPRRGGLTWTRRGGLLGQGGGCRGPSPTFGWLERLFTRPRLGGSQVLHSPSGGLKGSSFIPGCEFKSIRSLFGSHRFFTHLGWVTRFILHVERTPLARVGIIYGALYRDFRLWRGQKHRRSLFSTASGLN